MSALAWIVLMAEVATAPTAPAQSCTPFELTPSPGRDRIEVSSRASASWCWYADGGTGILLSLSDPSHPWHECRNPIRLSIWIHIDDAPRVVDEIGAEIPSSQFRPLDPRGDAVPDFSTKGPAIRVGEWDSGFLFACHASAWYWLAFSH